MNTLITNIGELATYNPNLDRVEKYDHVALEVREGLVSALYSGEDSPFTGDYDLTVDAKGKLITPGFVDAHTHPVFAETRENEFEMRLKGASYQQIAKNGGGIINSAKQLRALPEVELLKRVRTRISRFISYGATTIEVKSGYGLDTENELKSLRVLNTLKNELPVELVITFLGAHDFPEEYRDDHDSYIRLITEEMLPEISENRLAEFCDVFCDAGAFSAEESREILESARSHQFKLTMHTDEFESIGGIQVARDVGVYSVHHLMTITPEDITILAESNIHPVVLPGTSFFLGEHRYAPAREMWNVSLPVAIASDSNPGSSMTYSMQMIVNLAAIYLKLLPDEILQAVTYNGALALRREEHKGCLTPGYDADFVLWNVGHWNQVPYEYGTNKVMTVFSGGKPICENALSLSIIRE